MHKCSSRLSIARTFITRCVLRLQTWIRTSSSLSRITRKSQALSIAWAGRKWKNLLKYFRQTGLMPAPIMPEWIRRHEHRTKMISWWKKLMWLWLPLLSVWGLTSLMCVMWFTMISRKVWKDIIRKPDVPEETEAKGSVLLSILIKTCKNWKSLCKASLLQSRKLASSFCWKPLRMPNHPFAAERRCYTISVRSIRKKIVEIVTTV